MAERFFAYNITPGRIQLEADEAHHALKVKRLNIGDAIEVTNGAGWVGFGQLVKGHPRRCEIDIFSVQHIEPPVHCLKLVVGITKTTERMEWMIEKCVELGVQEISFTTMDRTQRSNVNLERLEKKAIGAIKQSKQAYLPHLTASSGLQEALSPEPDSPIFIADVEAKIDAKSALTQKPIKKTIVIIGPEGGFSAEEQQVFLERRAQKINLGPSTLRTETAAIYICALFRSQVLF